MKELVCVFLIAIISGCTCALSKNESAGKEWVTDYSVDIDDAEKNDVTFHEVEEPYRNDAINTLTSKTLIEISNKEAILYTNGETFFPKDKKLYLVRSVYGYLGTGGYEVKYDGSHLIVHHSSLGSCMLYNKSALVVELNSEPKQVDVYVSVAR